MWAVVFGASCCTVALLYFYLFSIYCFMGSKYKFRYSIYYDALINKISVHFNKVSIKVAGITW